MHVLVQFVTVILYIIMYKNISPYCHRKLLIHAQLLFIYHYSYFMRAHMRPSIFSSHYLVKIASPSQSVGQVWEVPLQRFEHPYHHDH